MSSEAAATAPGAAEGTEQKKEKVDEEQPVANVAKAEDAEANVKPPKHKPIRYTKEARLGAANNHFQQDDGLKGWVTKQHGSDGERTNGPGAVTEGGKEGETSASRKRTGLGEHREDGDGEDTELSKSIRPPAKYQKQGPRTSGTAEELMKEVDNNCLKRTDSSVVHVPKHFKRRTFSYE